jgi:hypothetical protein
LPELGNGTDYLSEVKVSTFGHMWHYFGSFSLKCSDINTTRLLLRREVLNCVPYFLCAHKWLNMKRKSLYLLRPDNKIASSELAIIEII